MSATTIICPNCQGTLTCDDTELGMTANCPLCSAPFTLAVSNPAPPQPQSQASNPGGPGGVSAPVAAAPSPNTGHALPASAPAAPAPLPSPASRNTGRVSLPTKSQPRIRHLIPLQHRLQRPKQGGSHDGNSSTASGLKAATPPFVRSWKLARKLGAHWAWLWQSRVESHSSCKFFTVFSPSFAEW